MAGDWIKLQRATPNKPEVWEIATLINLDPDAVLGKLIKVWFWFDEQTEHGNAENVTPVTLLKRIDTLVNVSGFAEAMHKVGWLNGTSIPNFDRHNGKSAKIRALTSERVKRKRNAQNVTDALPEKRREEVKEIQRKNGKKHKTSLPDGFCISHQVAEWALEKGYTQLDKHLAAFTDTCQANGYTYSNWDAALRRAIRDNWAKIPSTQKKLAL